MQHAALEAASKLKRTIRRNGAFLLLFDKQDRILAIQRKESKLFELPGGGIKDEIGERPEDAGKRESEK